VLGLLLLIAFVGLTCVQADKVHQNIHKYFETHEHSEEISSIVLLKDEADVTRAVAGVPFKERGQVVFDLLTKKAAITQPPVISVLKALDIKYKSYWLVNMIVIQANYSTLLSVSKHEAISDVHPNFEFRVHLETPDEIIETGDDSFPHIERDEAPDAIEWNVNKVNAPQVWAKEITGTGYTVASADTGVQWDHPALKAHYRGYTSDTSVDHNYNWWDAVHSTGSRCGANSKVPCDDNGHGTHTVGTMVGVDPAGTNQIGVAPGAKWIGCRNMNSGLGTPVLYIECLQFYVAPTDLLGANPDPKRAPHAIGNSYGCPASEGCVANSLQKAVDSVWAAGIFMSVSAGNSGPSCSTVNDPPGLYANVFSVGALGYNTNTIASYSSRGPVTVDGSGTLKPDISAPGSSVRSAYPTNSYASLSGTSMASPHITGIIALLWNAKPELARDIARTSLVLQQTALPLASTACGGNTTQNNVYGAGGVDILKAVNA